MKKWTWKKLALCMNGGILLQTAGCVELGLGVTSVATTVTAGGLIYLITRILED